MLKKYWLKKGKDIGSSVKNRENIKRKQRPVIFAKNGSFNSGQNGRVGISLEFPSKNFFHLKSVCTFFSEITHTPVKNQMLPRPLMNIFLYLSTINLFQIGKQLKEGEGEKGIQHKQSHQTCPGSHRSKLSEKQGFTSYQFSFEFSVFYCRLIDFICLLLVLIFLTQMITLIESTKN